MRPERVRCILGAVLAVGLLSTACTADSGRSGGPGEGGPASASPTAPAPTPTSVERTMGEPATVTLRGRDGGRSEVEVAVTEVVRGRIRDLAQFRLDAESRRSTPYYATVRVTNTGGGDLSRRRVTLWALDSSGTVRPPAEVIGTFRRCQDDPLPRRFARDESARTCLLFLLPRGTGLDAVQYRFNDRPPFSWPVG